MDPLSVLGAAAIGAMGVCAATDCTEPKPPPQVSVVQRTETAPPALEPPRCPPVPQPVQLTCAPQQTVHCPTPPEFPMSRGTPRTTVVHPPAVNVHVSFPETAHACPPHMAPLTILNVQRKGDEGKTEEKRPHELKGQLLLFRWFLELAAPLFPELAKEATEPIKPDKSTPSPTSLLTLLVTLALTINIPIAANVNLGGRRGTKKASSRCVSKRAP